MPAPEDRPLVGNRVWAPKDGYNLAASSYDDWYWRPFWPRNEKPHIERIAAQISSSSLSLDIGCGSGLYCHVLEKLGRVVGIDQSIEMLKLAKRDASRTTRLVCGRANALPIRNQSADLVIAARSLCHEPDLEKAFSELARVTRTNGVCIISEVHGRHPYPRTRIQLGEEDVHIETYKRTPQDLLGIARASGLWKIEECLEINWNDLLWQPEDPRFFRIDRSGVLPIFFIIAFRRI
jgi:SAM-dependent methyltransferase